MINKLITNKTEIPYWSIGKKVKVTQCLYGHKFPIGTVVEIVDHDPSEFDNPWLCTDGKKYWWLFEQEGYILPEDLDTLEKLGAIHEK